MAADGRRNVLRASFGTPGWRETSRAEPLGERARAPTFTRGIEHREYDPPEDRLELTAQGLGKEGGDERRVIATDATCPGSEHQMLVPMTGCHGEHPLHSLPHQLFDQLR